MESSGTKNNYKMLVKKLSQKAKHQIEQEVAQLQNINADSRLTTLTTEVEGGGPPEDELPLRMSNLERL